jgi:hypothetical protein
MKHRLMLLAGTGLLLGAFLWAAPGQAALPGAETCLIKGSATITPGLKIAPQSGSVSISGNLSLCHGSNLKIAKGTVSASASGTGSCAASEDHLSGTITWLKSSGVSLGTSTLSGTLVSVGPVANFAGTITGGLFAGSPVTTTAEFQPAGGATKATQCNSSTGLTNVTFEGVTT